MAYNSPSRPGMADGSGSAYANLPDVWQKEILASLKENLLADKLFMKKSVKGGHVAKFRVMGKGSAKFHVVGEEIFDGSNSYLAGIGYNIRSIYIDRPLVAAEALDLQELDMSGVPEALRMEITKELGHRLADKYDQYAFQKAVMAARDSAVVTGEPNGAAITDADAGSNAASLIGSLVTAAKTLDNNNVDARDRYVALNPTQYWALFYDVTNIPSLFHFDKDVGGTGDLGQGTLPNIAGFKIIKSVNFPSTDLSSAITGDRNDYSADFSTTVALAFHKSCIGQVVKDGLQTNQYEDLNSLEYRIQAMLEVGFGVLRPEAAVEIKTA